MWQEHLSTSFKRVLQSLTNNRRNYINLVLFYIVHDIYLLKLEAFISGST